MWLQSNQVSSSTNNYLSCKNTASQQQTNCGTSEGGGERILAYNTEVEWDDLPLPFKVKPVAEETTHI